jgi:hypothetical protein
MKFLIKYIADPLGEVKVGEIGAWFGRRNFSLSSMSKAVSRALWRYRLKYIIPKKASMAPIYHFAFFLAVTSYVFTEHPQRSILNLLVYLLSIFIYPKLSFF